MSERFDGPGKRLIGRCIFVQNLDDCVVLALVQVNSGFDKSHGAAGIG